MDLLVTDDMQQDSRPALAAFQSWDQVMLAAVPIGYRPPAQRTEPPGQGEFEALDRKSVV